MKSLYVEGSSYSDQLKISRWSSTGFPASAPLEGLPDGAPPLPPFDDVVVVLLHAATSSINPPRPSAERRGIRRPASDSTSRCSASSFGLVSTGASRLRWSRFFVIVAPCRVAALLMWIGEQHRRAGLPLDGDRVARPEVVVAADVAGPLLAHEHARPPVEDSDQLDLVSEVHLRVQHPTCGVGCGPVRAASACGDPHPCGADAHP